MSCSDRISQQLTEADARRDSNPFKILMNVWGRHVGSSDQCNSGKHRSGSSCSFQFCNVFNVSSVGCRKREKLPSEVLTSKEIWKVDLNLARGDETIV
jgi:hypothetical protein